MSKAKSDSTDLLAAKVGYKIRFAEEKQAYTIQARGSRYLVCTKPFNAQHTTLYTVVDLEENIRGTENLVFSMGAETRKQCREMLRRLEGYDSSVGEIKSEVSYRNRIPLIVVKVFRG